MHELFTNSAMRMAIARSNPSNGRLLASMISPAAMARAELVLGVVFSLGSAPITSAPASATTEAAQYVFIQ
ncbi:MAG: hypothetical protein DMG90_15580 [Acidobacteria bacterium]|nr:MAG: hypothetical protein DMG90_15580 [Acidobacteriota bacterium]